MTAILSDALIAEIEAEMRRLEDDPTVTKRQLRLFLQHPMECGHAAGNLLTCDAPPFGCVVCNDEERLCASHRLLMDVARAALKDERDGFALSDDLMKALRAADMGGEDD